MNSIRVLMVDDHAMVRHGLKSLLSVYDDIHIVGEAANGVEALEATGRLLPDVVLLDIQLPGPNGVELVNQLVQRAPQTKVVMLTAFDDNEYLLGALSAGAYAYLLKNSSGETVAETLRTVHAGKRLISPSLIDPVLRQFEAMAKAHVRIESRLTEEEIKAMRLVANGATNEEIAKEMYWGERTAQRKIEDIIAKLGARNRAQAVAEAIKRGLI